MDKQKSLRRRRILLILDNLEADWAEDVMRKKDPNAKYHLLTLGVSPEQAFLRYRSSAAELKHSIDIVDTSGISEKAEEEARDFYLEFIRSYPQQKHSCALSILEVLSYKTRNLWWYLGVSEKNIWNDPFIHRLYAFLRLLYVCRGGGFLEARLYVEDALLADVLRKCLIGQKIEIIGVPLGGRNREKGTLTFAFSYFLQIGREIVKFILTWIALKASGIKAGNDIAPETIGFFSIYPDWWKRPFSEDAVDLFFNQLPQVLAEKGQVRQILWLMPWQSLFKKRKEIVAFLRKRPVTVLAGMLNIVDIFLLFDPNLFLKVMKAFGIARKSPVFLKGVDISSLIRESLYRSLTSPMVFHCLQMDLALARARLQNLKVLFFRLEFQPLERAILYNTRGKTKTIGFQHSALGRNFLNYAFADGELGDHWRQRDDTNSMPLPDYIITSGELGVRYMIRAGYPRDHIGVGGAVRFSQLYDYARGIPSKEVLRNRYTLSLNKKIILVAPSPLLQETLCLLDDLFAAAMERPSDFHVIIKCHPDALKVPGYVKKVHQILDIYKDISSNLLTGPVNLHEYIGLADAVILTGGTVALEAMLLGCISIIYVNEAQFSHNPMTEYPDAVLLVMDRESMTRALESIIAGGAIEKLRLFWGRPLRDMFYDTKENPSMRFLSVVRNQFHISC